MSRRNARAGYHSLARDFGPVTPHSMDLRFLVDFGTVSVHHRGDVIKWKST